jgi:hypothetical protein
MIFCDSDGLTRSEAITNFCRKSNPSSLAIFPFEPLIIHCLGKTNPAKKNKVNMVGYLSGIKLLRLKMGRNKV